MSDRPHYTHKFSHEFEAGPSGPARSYWLVDGPGMQSNLGPVCLHHSETGMNPDATMRSICHALNTAFEAGRSAKAGEIRKALDIK